MSSAGQLSIANRIPGERIATTTVTVDSAGFTTTETEVASVTAPLVAGRTYKVRFAGKFGTGTAGSVMTGRLRLTDTTGTGIYSLVMEIPTTAGLGYGINMEAEFTAASTGNQEFIASGQQVSGGTIQLEATAGSPTLLYVDYISG
jgi:hypothetical protein